MTMEAKKHDLVISKVFDAPVEAVWKGWTDGETLMKWWGPNGFTSPLAKMDVREGGTSMVGMSSPQFGTNYSLWAYEQIVPLERIVFIHNLADEAGNKIDPASIGMPPDFPIDQRHVFAFKALDGGKTELTVTEYGWTEGQMMEMSRMGMEQTLDKLAAVLRGENPNG